MTSFLAALKGSNVHYKAIAGVDEAGRGPLAGAVVASAVMLGKTPVPERLNDSKKLSASIRDALYDELTDADHIWAIGVASVEEIDRINILQATMLAMQRAVTNLACKPGLVLVDGNRLPKLDLPARAVVKGDGLVQAISAASVLAKVTRDRQMLELDRRYPQYGFARHKGYGTAEHIRALQEHGPVRVHRQSFAPVRQAVLAQKSQGTALSDM